MRRFQAFDNSRSVFKSIYNWFWKPRWCDLWPLVCSSRISLQLTWFLQLIWMRSLVSWMHHVRSVFASTFTLSIWASLKTCEIVWSFRLSRTRIDTLCKSRNILWNTQLHLNYSTRNCTNSKCYSWRITILIHSFTSIRSKRKT